MRIAQVEIVNRKRIADESEIKLEKKFRIETPGGGSSSKDDQQQQWGGRTPSSARSRFGL